MLCRDKLLWAWNTLRFLEMYYSRDGARVCGIGGLLSEKEHDSSAMEATGVAFSLSSSIGHCVLFDFLHSAGFYLITHDTTCTESYVVAFPLELALSLSSLSFSDFGVHFTAFIEDYRS